MRKEGKTKTIGRKPSSSKDRVEWKFDDDFVLIGLYGYQSLQEDGSNMINQLGFYTLDVQCAEKTTDE